MSDMIHPQANNMAGLASMLSAKPNTGDQERNSTERFQDTLHPEKQTAHISPTNKPISKATTGKPKLNTTVRHVRLVTAQPHEPTAHRPEIQNHTQNSDNKNKDVKPFEDKHQAVINPHNPLQLQHIRPEQNTEFLAENDVLTDLDLSLDPSRDETDQYDENTYQTQKIPHIIPQQPEQIIIQSYVNKGAHDDHTETEPTDYPAGDVLFTDYPKSDDQIPKPSLTADKNPMRQATDTVAHDSITLDGEEQKLVDTFMRSEILQNLGQEKGSFVATMSNHQETNPDVNLWITENQVFRQENPHAPKTMSSTTIQSDDSQDIQSKELTIEMIDPEKVKDEYTIKFATTHKNTQFTESQIVSLKRSSIVPLQFDPQQTKDQSPTLLKNTSFLTQPSESKSIEQESTNNSMDFSQFSGMSSPFKGSVEQAKQVVHHLISSNPAVEFIETLRQHFKSFSKNQNPRLTVNMRHNGKNLTIHFMTNQTDHMHITFRTKDKEWEQLLIENRQVITDLFNSSDHTINIKYLGDEE
ncbi:MAG: hypothetical protein Q8K36_03440 [Alphaproteobacteria bacterium]|nr:hypothetical protein [Alphaproteobacteria bacterium]